MFKKVSLLLQYVTNQSANVVFVIMSLMPMLLGIIPLAIFLLSPPNAFLSGICIPMGIIGMLSPMPDYMDVHLICKQVPKRCFRSYSK